MRATQAPPFITHAGEMTPLHIYQQTFLLGLETYVDQVKFIGDRDAEGDVTKYAQRAGRFAEIFAETIFEMVGRPISPALNEVA